MDLIDEDQAASLSPTAVTTPSRPLSVSQMANPYTLSSDQYTEFDPSGFNEDYVANYPAPSSGYMDYHTEPLHPYATAFPGLLYTNFDEQNPLPKFGESETVGMGG